MVQMCTIVLQMQMVQMYTMHFKGIWYRCTQFTTKCTKKVQMYTMPTNVSGTDSHIELPMYMVQMYIMDVTDVQS